MNLKQIKRVFEKGDIDKNTFIDEMHKVHQILFEYAEYLKETEIQSIIVKDDSVIMSSRPDRFHKTSVSFYSDILDKRTTTIEALNFGKYEQEDSEMIYRIIEPHYTVFDIGGNIGWYTNHIASMLTSGKVYSFEPIPETFQKLSRNVELNQLNNITLNNFAFSDKIDTIKFFYSPSIPGAASSAQIIENIPMQELICKTNTIDNYINETSLSRLDFIKCDVEGAELLVFKGGRQSIDKFKPIVFTEMLRKWSAKFDYHPNDIIIFFSDLGYQCFVADGEGLREIKEVTDKTIETNYIFVHPEAHKTKLAALLNN